MSLEALVLLAVFVVLPLIQRLLGASQERRRRTGARANMPPRQAPPRAGVGAVPPMPDTAPRLASDATAEGSSTAARAPARPVARVLAPRRAAAVTGLHGRLELRRAMVLMAVLGPCRATNAYDWPAPVGRQ